MTTDKKAQKTDIAPPAPPSTEIQEEGEEELGLIQGFEGLHQLADRAQKHANDGTFIAKLRNNPAQAIQSELRDNTYELLKRLVFWCGRHAVRFRDSEDDIYDLQKEVERQGRLLRDMVTGSVLSIAAALANLVMQRVNDQEIRTLAQSLLTSLGPISGVAAPHDAGEMAPQSDGQPDENISENEPTKTPSPELKHPVDTQA